MTGGRVEGRPICRKIYLSPPDKGRDLLKQVRTHLIETAKPLMQAGVKVVSLHHGMSTVTGEACVLLTLAEPPSYRQTKKS